jgi:hypothetical protein
MQSGAKHLYCSSESIRLLTAGKMLRSALHDILYAFDEQVLTFSD